MFLGQLGQIPCILPCGIYSVALSHSLLIAVFLLMKPFQNSPIKNGLCLNPHKCIYIS